MKTTIAALVASAMIAAPAAVAGGFGGLPDAASFGQCTAYHANEDGREDGNASQAPPFANATVPDDCSDLAPQPPEDPGAAADEHRPEDPGRSGEHGPP